MEEKKKKEGVNQIMVDGRKIKTFWLKVSVNKKTKELERIEFQGEMIQNNDEDVYHLLMLQKPCDYIHKGRKIKVKCILKINEEREDSGISTWFDGKLIPVKEQDPPIYIR